MIIHKFLFFNYYDKTIQKKLERITKWIYLKLITFHDIGLKFLMLTFLIGADMFSFSFSVWTEPDSAKKKKFKLITHP